MLELAVTKDGIIENYKFDESKPKVLAYKNDPDWYEYLFSKDTTYEAYVDIMKYYSDFEFVHYVGIEEDKDIERMIEIARKYGIEFPIYLDIGNIYAKKNGYVSRGIAVVCAITGKDNKGYGAAVMGTRMSPFDQAMRKAIAQIKRENNGL